MTLRLLIRPFVPSLVTVLLIAIPAIADPAVLDVVVTSTLATPKEHAKSYREVLHQSARTALMSLEPAAEPDDRAVPADGAAQYRLFVDHKGVVAVGGALKVFSMHPLKTELVGNKFIIGPDKTKYETYWYLPYQHKGTVALRLAEWKGGKYQTLLTWSAVIPEPTDDIDRKGLVEVARLSQDMAKAALNFKPVFPKKVEEARTEALNAMLPEDYGEGLLQGLVTGRVVKTKAGPDETTADVSFLNKSPWPVKKVKVTVITAANAFIGNEDTELEFAQPLAPGKSALLKHSGAASANDTRLTGLKPGVTIKGVEFDPK